MALVVYDARCCPSCGAFDSSLRSAPDELPIKTKHPDGRMFEVQRWRCLACGVVDLAKRDFESAHEKEKPMRGQPGSKDGLMFVARLNNDGGAPDAE